MSTDYISFIIDGSAERNGNIPADAFIAKLRLFMATLYGFDRAFSKKDRRQIDLEIVSLSRSSPATIRFRPRSKAQGYPVAAAMNWTFEQLECVYDNRSIDPQIPQQLLDNLVELSDLKKATLPELSILRMEYSGRTIAFDSVMESHALALRAAVQPDQQRYKWHAGVSHGSMFGELRGVMDFEGERQFFIMPPSGADRIQCIFSEDMRTLMNQHLFQVVRVHGFLHYDGENPFPYLMEADRIEGVDAGQYRHFVDLPGFFRDDAMPADNQGFDHL